MIALALLAALGVAASACSSSDTSATDDPVVTSAPQTTTAVESPQSTTTSAVVLTGAVDEEFLAKQASSVPVPDEQGAFLVAVIDEQGAVVHGAKGADPSGNTPTPDDTFGIGSITKVFTSILTLTLVDEGLVDLDASAAEYVTRVSVPEGVTVRDLLQHTSGIPNVTDEPGFFSRMVDDPSRAWPAGSAIALVEDSEPFFESGARFSYSNTNYLILGILIEEVTGNAFVDELRARLIEPLGLSSTYLAGYEEGPAPFTAYTSLSGRLAPIDFDYTSIATDAWAAGAMVSSVGDLHRLLSALFEERLVSTESLAAMTENNEYGLGIARSDSAEGVYGHGGGIAGYQTLVAHVPATGTTAFWVVTGDTLSFERAIDAVQERISQG